MTDELSRTSALAERHRALGSDLEDWNGMGTAWTYHTDPEDEHDAVREVAGMFDMSPLKKVRVTGPDAAAVVDHLHSRDLGRIGPGASAYGAVLTERGTVADDAIAFNGGFTGGNDSETAGWLVVHGSGATMELLGESAAGRDVEFVLDDDLHIVSLQGPSSLQILDRASPDDLASLAYFHHLDTDLFGHSVTISRTGYSGERGYEIFAPAESVGAVWDAILADEHAAGVMPASFTALDKVRVEAALLFYGYDMTDDHFPSEVGLGWAVSRNGMTYRGRDGALSAMGSERFTLTGLVVDLDGMVAGGETIRLDGTDVGVVNSPAWSHRLSTSLALGHLSPAANVPGTVVELVGDGVTNRATVARIPFFDPEKTRTHAP